MGAPVLRNADTVKDDDAVTDSTINVNEDPDPTLVSEYDCDTVDVAVKSDDSAMMLPELSLGAMVHVNVVLVRIGVEGGLHDSVEAVVGLPYTTKLCAPLTMLVAVADELTRILNAADDFCGTTENVNVFPPLFDDSVNGDVRLPVDTAT